MNELINNNQNKKRIIVQGFLLAGAMALADQSVVLPVIVKYFSNSNTMVGIFTSLLRGGAIIMQLYAAFHARNDAFIKPKLIKVFSMRFSSWFSIGLIILFFGNSYPNLTLLLFSISLFLFSFSAGFGTVYYQELMGKMFTKEYRGKLIAQRQILAGLASIIGVVGISGYFLEHFEAPNSFAYIFMVSGLIMAAGFLYFIPLKEKEKTNFSTEERNFSSFIKKALTFVKQDKQFRTQIITRLSSLGFLLLMPFIILHARQNYNIGGKEIALFAGIQMFGAMSANFLWGKLSGMGKDRMIVILSFSINIFAYLLLVIFDSYALYFIVFFILGASVDGYRLAFSNLLLTRAPEKYRTSYIAVYNNIIAIGLFFSIPGGIILDAFGFTSLTILSISLLSFGLLMSLNLNRICISAKS